MHRWLVVVVLSVLINGAAFGGGGAELPSPSTGVINGKTAVRLVPGVRQSDGAVKAGDLSSCEVVLVPATAQERELRYPCGTWFLPPAIGRYVDWLEQGSKVSAQGVLNYGAPAFRDQGFTFMPELVPAGFVRASAGQVPAAHTFRVLSLAVQGHTRPFDRRLPPERATETVRLPLGPAIGGVFDEKGNARSLSRPVIVEAGATKVIPRRTPQQADVLLVASRDPQRDPRDLQCQTSIAIGGEARNASVRMDGWERFVAVWYELPQGPAKLNLSCNGVKVADVSLSLMAGKIITVREDIDD